ncbi:MAG: hypothetical protein H7A43_04790 [Verrucomicrobia bacterium]|nr:hypothetical protein [Kiritimatiellia bacterium]MCP5487945.1 hypothetical protein [Verrucomicrobiota bacterium]
MSNKQSGMCAILVGLGLIGPVHGQVVVDVSPPQGITLSIYDEGFALVSESRRAVLEQGDQDLRVTQLPALIDVSSVTHASVGRSTDFDVLEKRFLYDYADAESLFSRLRGVDVSILADGREISGEARYLRDQRGAEWISLNRADGLSLFPLDGITSLTAERSRLIAYPEPTMIWRTRTTQEGPKTFRVGYRTDGISWKAYYDILLRRSTADFFAKVELENQSGVDYEDARVRMIMTEKGLLAPLNRVVHAGREEVPAMRYVYGLPQPVWEQSVAGLTPEEIFELPRNVNLPEQDRVFVHFASATDMPMEKFFLYDGVKFDRFQRNRRNDWNYGTEFHQVVETYVEFENSEARGIGRSLPPGWLRLFDAREDGAVDFLGEAFMLPVAVGEKGRVRLGPARGLIGERERMSYEEVTPLHEYEESFEIRLINTSEEDAEIRVVEHLYRWQNFELVKSDTEYETIGPQTIEFRPTVKAGGRRSIHYTVRYTW